MPSLILVRNNVLNVWLAVIIYHIQGMWPVMRIVTQHILVVRMFLQQALAVTMVCLMIQMNAQRIAVVVIVTMSISVTGT